MLLEEFGHAGWNPVRHYDAMAHAAPAAGAAGAGVAGEWGVRWLAPELSYQSLPPRDVLHVAAIRASLLPLPDLVKGWPAKSTGIDPSPRVHLRIDLYRYFFPATAGDCSWPTEPHGLGMERPVESQSTYVLIPSAPGSIKDAMEKVSKVIGQLNADHALGILQEDWFSGSSSRRSPADALGLPLTLLSFTGKESVIRVPWCWMHATGLGFRRYVTSALLHPMSTPMTRDVPGGHLYVLESSVAGPCSSSINRAGKDVALGLTDSPWSANGELRSTGWKRPARLGRFTDLLQLKGPRHLEQ